MIRNDTELFRWLKPSELRDPNSIEKVLNDQTGVGKKRFVIVPLALPHQIALNGDVDWARGLDWIREVWRRATGVTISGRTDLSSAGVDWAIVAVVKTPFVVDSDSNAARDFFEACNALVLAGATVFEGKEDSESKDVEKYLLGILDVAADPFPTPDVRQHGHSILAEFLKSLPEAEIEGLGGDNLTPEECAARESIEGSLKEVFKSLNHADRPLRRGQLKNVFVGSWANP